MGDGCKGRPLAALPAWQQSSAPPTSFRSLPSPPLHADVQAHVGEGVDPAEMLSSYDAVVLAAGATKPRDLPVEGR